MNLVQPPVLLPLLLPAALFASPSQSSAGHIDSSSVAPAVQEAAERVRILPLSHAEARTLAKLLESFLERGEIVRADERTNSLLVSAPTDRLAEIGELAGQLDRPAGPGTEVASGTRRERAAAAADDIFPSVSGDFVLDLDEAGGAPHLWRVAQQYARLTGQHLVASEETRTLLSSTATPLSASVNVPAAGVQTFFESLLQSADVVLIPLQGTRPRLVRLVSMRTQERSSVGALAIALDPAESLDFSRRHPAVPLQTTLDMRSDVRQLANALRTMFPDANAIQILPAGATNSLILRGTGARLAPLIETLHAIDSATPEPAEAQPPQQASQG